MSDWQKPTMRHIGKVHGISIALLHQETWKPYMRLGPTHTDLMAADIHTKFYPEKAAAAWEKVRTLINVLSGDQKALLGGPGRGWKHRDDNPHLYERIGQLEEQDDETTGAASEGVDLACASEPGPATPPLIKTIGCDFAGMGSAVEGILDIYPNAAVYFV